MNAEQSEARWVRKETENIYFHKRRERDIPPFGCCIPLGKHSSLSSILTISLQKQKRLTASVLKGTHVNCKVRSPTPHNTETQHHHPWETAVKKDGGKTVLCYTGPASLKLTPTWHRPQEWKSFWKKKEKNTPHTNHLTLSQEQVSSHRSPVGRERGKCCK